MFDLYCAHCGEPWEHDILHETPRGLGYMDAAKSFKVQGCGLFNTILRERLEGSPRCLYIRASCKRRRVIRYQSRP